MTDTERLETLLRHVGRAQQLLQSFSEPSLGPNGGPPLEDFLRSLRQELSHWEVHAAMRPGASRADPEE